MRFFHLIPILCLLSPVLGKDKPSFNKQAKREKCLVVHRSIRRCAEWWCWSKWITLTPAKYGLDCPALLVSIGLWTLKPTSLRKKKCQRPVEAEANRWWAVYISYALTGTSIDSHQNNTSTSIKSTHLLPSSLNPPRFNCLLNIKLWRPAHDPAPHNLIFSFPSRYPQVLHKYGYWTPHTHQWRQLEWKW